MSYFFDPEDFSDPEFDEDLMLNQIQMLTIQSRRDLERKTVEDLKKAVQTWMWNPLGREVSTSEFVLIIILRTDGSLDPHWHGRKMVLHFQDTLMTVLTKWQIPESVPVLICEFWNKNDVPINTSRALLTSELNEADNPSAAQYLRESQTTERSNHIPSLR